jgi:hypothetical protein
MPVMDDSLRPAVDCVGNELFTIVHCLPAQRFVPQFE